MKSYPYARTEGDNVTAEVIRRYIRYHHEQEKSPRKQNLFDGSPAL